MKTLLDLYEFAESNDIDIYFFSMKHTESLALPKDESNNAAIAIDPKKIRSCADEKVKLAHELGHCMTGSYYTEGADRSVRGKCENRATKWAILHTIPEDELNRAVSNGYTELWELADYFDVPESFMEVVIYYYKNKHIPARAK